MQSRLYIDGEEWVPSKHMAKKAGLVADYVSRLCRQGEVRGRKIDGVWYVSVTSFTLFQENALKRKAEQRATLANLRKEEYIDNVARTDRDVVPKPFTFPRLTLPRHLIETLHLLVVVGVGSYGVHAFQIIPRTVVPRTVEHFATTQPANIFSAAGDALSTFTQSLITRFFGTEDEAPQTE